MQIDSALALQTLTTSARDQTAAPARPGANPATNTEPDPANTHDTGPASDKVSVSEPGRILSAGAAGGIVRQRSTSVVIETRDGDRIRLDIQALARLDAAAAAATDGERQLAGAAVRRGSEFSLRFSVEGTLDHRELKSLARVLHQVEKAAKEFYEGETNEALEKLGKMKIDPKVLSSVSVDFRRSIAIRYAEIQRLSDTPASTSSVGAAPATPSPANADSSSSQPAGTAPAPAMPDKRTVMPATPASNNESAPASTNISPVSSGTTRMSPKIPTPAQAEPSLPPQASPVARFVLAIRSSVSIAAESGLFRSPEAGVKTLFQSVMALVAELRGAAEGKNSKGLPDILDALLETVTKTDGEEIEPKDHVPAASSEPDEETATKHPLDEQPEEMNAIGSAATASDRQPDIEADPVNSSAAG